MLEATIDYGTLVAAAASPDCAAPVSQASGSFASIEVDLERTFPGHAWLDTPAGTAR